MQLRHYYTLWWLHLSRGLDLRHARCPSTTSSQWPWVNCPLFPLSVRLWLSSSHLWSSINSLCSLPFRQPGCALWAWRCQSEWLCLWQLHRGNGVGRQDSSATTGGEMRPDVAQWHVTHAPGLSAIHYSEGKCVYARLRACSVCACVCAYCDSHE